MLHICLIELLCGVTKKGVCSAHKHCSSSLCVANTESMEGGGEGRGGLIAVHNVEMV